MKRYFITFQYDGTAYHGWQVQPNGHSVQAALQAAMSTLLRTPCEVVGAGRTDAGVHASKMVAHFDLEEGIDCEQVAYRLNRILPHDISVLGIQPVDSGMHARFSAVERTYHYYIHTRKDPFVRHYSCFVPYDLDFEAMNEAGRLLTTYEDFGAFCKSHTDVKTTLCRVTEVRWECLASHRYRLIIRANRFLRNMVRAVTGTLIDVGRGRITLPELQDIVESGKRTRAGESMPAHALFLHDIKY